MRLRLAAAGMSAVALALVVLAVPAGGPGPGDTAALETSIERLLESASAGPRDEPALQALLQRQLEQRPGDARALVLQARIDLQAGRHAQAAAGYAKALVDGSKVARDAGVWVEYAEALGLAQGGTLAGEPLRMVERALAIDARHPAALDLAASAAWERGAFADAALHWQRLLAQLAPGSARHAQLSAAIESAQRRARMGLPPAR